MLSIWAVVLPLLAAFLYSRSNVLYRFYANAPGRLPRIQNLKNPEIRFTDLVSNCEDAVLDTDRGFALFSCDPGRDAWNTVMGTFDNPRPPPETGMENDSVNFWHIAWNVVPSEGFVLNLKDYRFECLRLYIWNYNDQSVTSKPEGLELLNFAEEAQHFHPLGIDYHAASNTLFVINHSLNESYLEVFELHPSKKMAVYKDRIKHSLLAAPNSVTAINEHELFVTNDHYFLRRNGQILPALETYLTIPGGSVAFVDRRPGVEHKVSTLARVSFANGIVKLSGSSLAVASSNMNAVYIYDIVFHGEEENPSLRHAKTLPVPFHPDNLSVDGEGKLLIAGHPHSPTFDKVVKERPVCGALEAQNFEGCTKGPSWIAEWSPQGGLKTLYTGDSYGTSTTAVRDVGRNIGIAVGLYERGVLVWNED